MALGTGVHNLSLVVRAHNRASRALASVGRDMTLLDRTRKTLQTGFQTLSRVGLLAIKALAVGVVIAVAASIFAFSKFDDALTGSLAIVEDVSPEIRKSLSDTAREIAKTTIFSANEAAEAYFHLFSAGQDVAQAMANLPTVAAFAQAGLFDLEVATELLVTAQSALGLSFDDPVENMREMARVADVLAAADQRAVGSIQDFAEALTNRAAAAMRTYGIEVEEGVAVLAAWATQGLKGRTAGQAFSTVVRDLQRAALKEADAFREANVAVFDSQENFRNMADIVHDLELAMEGLTDAGKKQLLQDLGFQERSQQRILQLLGTSDAIREFEAAFKKAGGTVQEVADKQLDSAWKKLGLLKSAIIDVFIGSGAAADEGFKKAIVRVTDFVNKVGPSIAKAAGVAADAFGRWVELMSDVVGHLSDFARGIDPSNIDKAADALEGLSDNSLILVGHIQKVITWWQRLSQPVKDFVGSMATLLPIITLVAGAIKLAAIVLGFFLSPALLVAVIIAGLVVGFQTLYKESKEFRDLIEEIGKFFKEEVGPLLAEGWVLIQEAAAKFLEWFQSTAVPFLVNAWERIKEGAAILVLWFENDLIPFLREAWEQIKDTFSAAWDFIQVLWDTILPILQSHWEVWGHRLWNAIKIAWDLIKEVFLGAWEVIEGIFQVFTAVLSGDWGLLWEGILSILKGAWRIIWGVITAIVRNMTNVWAGLVATLGEAWSSFWDTIKSIASGAWDIFTGWVSGAWETFKETWSSGWESLKEAAGDALGGLGDVVKWPFNIVLGLIESTINTAIDGLNNLINLINKIPSISIPTIGRVSLPRLALGGDVVREGLAIVGERGPELLRLGRGAQVAPLESVNGDIGGGPTIQIDQIVFQGTPVEMLEDWRRHTKLALRGL